MRVISLFSGAGGMDLGFIQAGHEVVWAIDNDRDCCETYRKNIGDHIVEGDISEMDSKSIPDGDIVIGGFPCQGFSVANTTRTAEDPRNGLYLEMVRIVKSKRPEYFVAENVKGLASAEEGTVLEKILSDFSSAGYRCSYKILNAADYGVPQKRERIIIIGTRSDIKEDAPFPRPTHAEQDKQDLKSTEELKEWITIGDVLKGIPEPADSSINLPNHTFSRYKLTFNGYLGHRFVDPDRPAPTITARGDNNGGVVVLHHPKNHRRMSARELATAQSFPLDYEFARSRTSAYRQIANAVPPLLAKRIGHCFQPGFK